MYWPSVLLLRTLCPFAQLLIGLFVLLVFNFLVLSLFWILILWQFFSSFYNMPLTVVIVSFAVQKLFNLV
jgi:hypothetical protein